eukprot:1144332-Pelagomonas_calceolata.AAC.2
MSGADTASGPASPGLGLHQRQAHKQISLTPTMGGTSFETFVCSWRTLFCPKARSIHPNAIGVTKEGSKTKSMLCSSVLALLCVLSEGLVHKHTNDTYHFIFEVMGILCVAGNPVDRAAKLPG